MGSIEFECRGEDCTEQVRMDEMSLRFIANSAGVDVDEVKRCDDCLEEWLGEDGVTLNIGVGSTHSAAQAAPDPENQPVRVEHVGRSRAFLDLPPPGSGAKEDLKEMDYDDVDYKPHTDEGVWSVRKECLEAVLDHMADAGWSVERDGDGTKMHSVRVVGDEKEPGGMRRSVLRAPRQAEDVLDDVELSAKPEFEPVERHWSVPSTDLDAVLQAFEQSGWRVETRSGA